MIKNNKVKMRVRSGEKGNVLFLILIAVALFAALSYAVTQSTRSGGGSTEREQSVLSGASMTQHPTALRTAIIRMILGGVDVADIQFNAPADFGDLTENIRGVFHPQGGAAVFQNAPADLVVGNTTGTWFYNGNYEVPQVGGDAAGGNEIIAFLPNVQTGVCQQVNREFAIDGTACTNTLGIPHLASTSDDIREQMDHTYALPLTTDEPDIQGVGCLVFEGQASGCFFDVTNSENVFYSVLLER